MFQRIRQTDYQMIGVTSPHHSLSRLKRHSPVKPCAIGTQSAIQWSDTTIMRLRLPTSPASLCRCHAYLLFCCLAANAFAERKPFPAQYVECVQGDKGADVASRSIRTPVFQSKQGFKAYGVVIANRSPEGACQNTTTVYVAEPAGTFRVAFQQQAERLPDGSVYDGNGIENIRWSPAGSRLFLEVSQWTWGTDSTWNTKYILVSTATGEVRELPVAAAIQKQFGKTCAWLASSKAWLDDVLLDIELKPYNEVDEEGNAGPTPSCVGKPTRFSFDVDSAGFPGPAINRHIPH